MLIARDAITVAGCYYENHPGNNRPTGAVYCALRIQGITRAATAESGGYFFLAAPVTRFAARTAELAATAARMSCLKAASSIFSPSRRSIARRTFPSRLELKSFFGSLREAPRKKVSFTTCL